MGVLIAVVVGLSAVILGGFYGYFAYEEHQKNQTAAALKIVIKYDLETCGEKFPLVIDLRKESDKTITKTEFDVEGFREGHSEPLYETGYPHYTTDRILAPGESVGLCWSIPKKAYGITENLIERYPPNAINWKVTNIRPTFETP